MPEEKVVAFRMPLEDFKKLQADRESRGMGWNAYTLNAFQQTYSVDIAIPEKAEKPKAEKQLSKAAQKRLDKAMRKAAEASGPEVTGDPGCALPPPPDELPPDPPPPES